MSAADDLFSDLVMVGVDTPQKLELVDTRMQPIRYMVNGADGEEPHEERAWIELFSMDSAKARAYDNSVQRRRLDVNARGKMVKLTPEQLEAETVDKLVALTNSWHFRRRNGDLIPFSQENARLLYGSGGAQYIREQVEGYIGERTNFDKP
jgi:hypothetical protein